MKSLRIIFLFLCIHLDLVAQEINDLISEIDKCDKTLLNVEKIIDKFSPLPTKYIFDTSDAIEYFGQNISDNSGVNERLIKKGFLNFKILYDEIFLLHGKEDNSRRDLFWISIYYQENKIAFLLITGKRTWDNKNYYFQHDTLYQFLDDACLDETLGSYNKIHNTNFSWRDLFGSDEYDMFSVVPGLGGRRISGRAAPFLVLIETRNRAEIIKNCKSFNPIRRTFGAFSLYCLQREGVALSEEEVRLLESIRCSDELISYSWGCTVMEREKISNILSDQEIEGYYYWVKNAGGLKSMK